MLIPVPAYGLSLTGGWAATLRDARTDSLGAAYVLAGVAAGVVYLLDRYQPSWWSRALLIVAVIGGTGALGWYDPVTLLTGVRP
ncbi:hypothetical protein AB0A77_28410 [Streptomyces varsoviensis]|uniref:hypothetical protein n=1 Tax=Streptomyces varsoviensis TaxID=67373 RepID=UPI0033DD870E